MCPLRIYMMPRPSDDPDTIRIATYIAATIGRCQRF